MVNLLQRRKKTANFSVNWPLVNGKASWQKTKVRPAEDPDSSGTVSTNAANHFTVQYRLCPRPIFSEKGLRREKKSTIIRFLLDTEAAFASITRGGFMIWTSSLAKKKKAQLHRKREWCGLGYIQFNEIWGDCEQGPVNRKDWDCLQTRAQTWEIFAPLLFKSPRIRSTTAMCVQYSAVHHRIL